jgi:hypothetical protein
LYFFYPERTLHGLPVRSIGYPGDWNRGRKMVPLKTRNRKPKKRPKNEEFNENEKKF